MDKAVESRDGLIAVVPTGDLMDRVISILDQARANVVRAVNSNMVIAYWLIGSEIVQALQGGEDRADYGSRLLADRSAALKTRYGRGYSVTNLKYFRLFYQTYSHRKPEIDHEPRDQFASVDNISVVSDLSAALDVVDQRRGFSTQLLQVKMINQCLLVPIAFVVSRKFSLHRLFGKRKQLSTLKQSEVCPHPS